jgi:peptidyl-prolyl cis-trans isomerase SurA
VAPIQREFEIMKSRLFASTAALVLAATSIAAQQSTIIQKVIVKVNGEIFTQTELEFRQIQALRDQNRQVAAADLGTDPGLRTALAEITPGILLDAVDELILVQHGIEAGAKFTDAIFQNALEDLKKANNIKDDATLEAALKQEGMTLADLRVNIERMSIIQSVQQNELMRNMTLTEEEARQYYNAHQAEFMKPSTVTLREIFVAVPTQTVNGQTTVNVALDDAAKAKIEAVRERAIKGEDFTALVAEVSESGTKANAGLIGPIALADLNPVVGEMLAKLPVGGVSEAIRTRTGYQLLKLETRSESEAEPFEKSRDQITQKILESRLEGEKDKLLQKLRTQAVIEWKDEAYEKMYDAALAQRGKTAAGSGGR